MTATSAAGHRRPAFGLPLLPRAQRARLQARIDRAQVRVAELQPADQAADDAAAAADAQADSLRSLQAATAAQRSQAELAWSWPRTSRSA